jgi:hypothetical protein
MAQSFVAAADCDSDRRAPPFRGDSIASTEEPMRMRFTKSWGMILLAIWLILMGLIPLAALHIDHSGTFMNILAIAAGLLILIGR